MRTPCIIWGMRDFTLLGETHREGPLVSLRFHPRLPLLSALDPTRDQGWVWTWDGDGALHSVARVGSGRRDRGRWDDLKTHLPYWINSAWHPTLPLLALSGLDGSVDLWAVEETGGEPGSRRLCDGALGARCLSFTHSGDALWVGGHIRHPTSGDYFSHLVDLQGKVLSRMLGCDTDIALHPEGELLASFVSDQGATLLRFARAPDGRGHDGLEMFDRALIIDVDGYEGLVFSPSGD